MHQGLKIIFMTFSYKCFQVLTMLAFMKKIPSVLVFLILLVTWIERPMNIISLSTYQQLIKGKVEEDKNYHIFFFFIFLSCRLFEVLQQKEKPSILLDIDKRYVRNILIAKHFLDLIIPLTFLSGWENRMFLLKCFLLQ